MPAWTWWASVLSFALASSISPGPVNLLTLSNTLSGYLNSSFRFITGATVGEVSNSEGNPATEILMPGAHNGIPRVRVRRVESFGRSIVDETHAQEVLLVSERRTNVFRTKETWPHMKEAYVITWDTSVPASDGSDLPLSALGLWLGDTETSGWTLFATAEQGKLENSPLWDVTFSARSA